jgi:hypothetical protein
VVEGGKPSAVVFAELAQLGEQALLGGAVAHSDKHGVVARDGANDLGIGEAIDGGTDAAGFSGWGMQDDQRVSGGGSIENGLAEHRLQWRTTGLHRALAGTDVAATFFAQTQGGDVATHRRLSDLPALGGESLADFLLGAKLAADTSSVSLRRRRARRLFMAASRRSVVAAALAASRVPAETASALAPSPSHSHAADAAARRARGCRFRR